MENKQFLSPNLETYLANMVLDLERAGRTPHRWEIKQMAKCILKAQGIKKEARNS
jgi:hypothetical protein